jgi:hypothetical protein
MAAADDGDCRGLGGSCVVARGTDQLSGHSVQLGYHQDMRFLSNISSMIVAAVLLFTGLIHAAQPYFFIHTIASYRLLSADVSGLLGLWLPYLQIVLAVCIGIRIAEKVALCMAAGVFTTFALAQTAVLMRGLEIDCGCFGFVAHAVSPGSVALPIALAGVCAIAVIGDRGFKDHELRSERRASTPARLRPD